MLIVIYIVTLVMFGSTWIAIKIGLGSLPPFTSAVLRFIIAFVVLGAAFRIWRFRLPARPSARKDIFLAGLFMYGLNFVFIYFGQQLIPSALGAVVYSTMPFFTGLFAHFMTTDERLTPRIIAGQMIGFLGIIILFAADLDFHGSFWGILSLLLGSASCSWATVKIKRDLDDIRPEQLAIIQIPIGLLLLVPIMLATESPFSIHLDLTGVGSITYLAIFGTGVAFMGWYYLLKRVGAVALSLMTFLEPLVAMLLGFLILGEILSVTVLAGGALILTGVLIATLRPKRA